MAKLKMKNIRIAVAKKDMKQTVSFIQKAGAIEIKTSKNIDGFGFEDTLSQKLTYERMVTSCENALEILQKFAPQKSSMLSFLNGRQEVSLDEYHERQSLSSATIQICYDIIALEKQLGECKGEISRISIALDEMKPWMKLDVPTGFVGTKTTSCFIGSLPFSATAGEIIAKLGEENYKGSLELEIVSSNEMQTCIFATSLKNDGEELSSALRKIGFVMVSNPDDKMVCAEKAVVLEKRSKALKQAVENITELIVSYQEKAENIKFFADFYAMRADRYELYGKLLQSKSVAIIDGFIPEKVAEALKENVETSFSAAVEITEPSEDEDVPVALSNGGFSSPVQSIVSMYSLPSKTDIDPTAPMSIFFYIFFGMMLSDAGYGLIITLACCFALWKFNLEDNWKSSLRLFRNCGISTIFWGVMFGGYFGDVVQQFARHFLGYEVIIKPLWIAPLEKPLVLLVAGIMIGIVHLFLGMLIKFVNLCRHKKVLDAIFDVGFWIITLVGVILMMVTPVAGMIGVTITISGLFTIGEYIAIAGAIGLVITQGRSKKGIGKVVSGVASLYDITSYASDILSYSRLMALGLATGVLAMAFNTLATMANGVLGYILFAVVFLLGTALSLAMNALGAYVHTVRLQYVEFFSKFYEGGGRAFKPFMAQTKFIRFKK